MKVPEGSSKNNCWHPAQYSCYLIGPGWGLKLSFSSPRFSNLSPIMLFLSCFVCACVFVCVFTCMFTCMCMRIHLCVYVCVFQPICWARRGDWLPTGCRQRCWLDIVRQSSVIYFWYKPRIDLVTVFHLCTVSYLYQDTKRNRNLIFTNYYF